MKTVGYEFRVLCFGLNLSDWELLKQRRNYKIEDSKVLRSLLKVEVVGT
jgi:hypothetical protein